MNQFMKRYRFILLSILTGSILFVITFFATDINYEYRHTIRVTSQIYREWVPKLEEKLIENSIRKVYFDVNLYSISDTISSVRSYELQHFYSGKEQIDKDLICYHNLMGINDYNTNNLNTVKKYIGCFRLMQPAMGSFLLVLLIGIVLQLFIKRKIDRK